MAEFAEDSEEEEAARQEALKKQQEALMARLKKTGSNSPDALPFGGALIRINGICYEPTQLRISSFAIKPYDGQIVAGQMYDATILLPGEAHPTEIPVHGAVKTCDDDFGLRAMFGSPQPYFQSLLANHLISLRKK